MTYGRQTTSSASDLRPGTMITDNVRLVTQIGEGGMGSVWLADHLALGVQVAVKFMMPALAKDPSAVERFTREAKMAARIRHPHVVRILDFGAPIGGLPYIVMDHLEGVDLETRIQQNGRLPLELVANVVMQTAKGLERAHELGIVHRDIKPENIFLSVELGDETFVKILDFGIAKEGDDGSTLRVTNTGETLGTPMYMSPEQMLCAKEVDPQCDLWALAVVAYYAVTGSLPFPGNTYAAICLAVNRGRFRPASHVRSAVPPELDAWFDRAFSREPRRRFHSARELGDAFVAAIQEVPAAQRRALTPFSAQATLMGACNTRRESSRRSSWGTTVGVVAVAAGALGAFLGRPFVEPMLHEHLAMASSPVAASTPQAEAPRAVLPVDVTPVVEAPVAASSPASDVPFGPPPPPSLQAAGATATASNQAIAEVRNQSSPRARSREAAPRERGSADGAHDIQVRDPQPRAEDGDNPYETTGTPAPSPPPSDTPPGA